MLTPKIFIMVSNILIFALVNGIDEPLNKMYPNDPIRTDITTYLRSLHNIVKFYSKEKNIVDANVAVGLFFVSANLKKSFPSKKELLLQSVREDIDLLIKKTDSLLIYFNSMVFMDNNQNDPMNELAKGVFPLFKNQSLWISEMPEFTSPYVTPIPNSNNTLAVRLSAMNSYELHTEAGIPAPETTILCMKELVDNPVHTTLGKCYLSDKCFSVITNGSDYGHSLTHRILMMLCARFGRRCNILSEEEDKMMLTKLCEIAYNEDVYLTMHEHFRMEWMLEQMLVCLLDNHVQFLRRSWFNIILERETPVGCFGRKDFQANSSDYADLEEYNKTWQFMRPIDWYLENGKCHNVITTLAAAVLSAGVKYILEVYY